MSTVSIVKWEDVLLLTLQGYMDDETAVSLAERLASAVVRHGARAVVIDISTVEVLDSFMARTLAGMAAACRLLGADTAVVGMRPDVAMTLVELGMPLPGVRTAINLERGLAMLRQRMADGR
ncbi:MAG: STAS domain-containing protein [Alphaproteobacteria bacterium]|nr:STAS domain-containing protein [Alphaproteobacteria bacterium]